MRVKPFVDTTTGLRSIPPGLHFVATPIGTARDITLRALDTLAGADLLAAEDTRTLRHLMEIHGIPLGTRQVLSYHEHSGSSVLPRLLAALREGKSVAYASEAGTPLISDPGFVLAREALAEGLPVTAAPGACAAICALTVSGLPSDRFLFAGFPPTTQSARQAFLTELKTVQATLIFYESPKRIHGLLEDLSQVLGEDRLAVICRELTKKFEEVLRGTLAALVADVAERTLKGEVVVLVDRALQAAVEPGALDAALDRAMATMTMKDAVAAVADAFGLPRREVYQLALGRKATGGERQD
jgi:16S rRNA (cytidine1402-2'-O)-methyltransferase